MCRSYQWARLYEGRCAVLVTLMLRRDVGMVSEGVEASSTTESAATAVATTARATRRSTVLSFVSWVGVSIGVRRLSNRSAASAIAEPDVGSDGRILCCCNSTCNGMLNTVLSLHEGNLLDHSFKILSFCSVGSFLSSSMEISKLVGGCAIVASLFTIC